MAKVPFGYMISLFLVFLVVLSPSCGCGWTRGGRPLDLFGSFLPLGHSSRSSLTHGNPSFHTTFLFPPCFTLPTPLVDSSLPNSFHLTVGFRQALLKKQQKIGFCLVFAFLLFLLPLLLLHLTLVTFFPLIHSLLLQLLQLQPTLVTFSLFFLIPSNPSPRTLPPFFPIGNQETVRGVDSMISRHVGTQHVWRAKDSNSNEGSGDYRA